MTSQLSLSEIMSRRSKPAPTGPVLVRGLALGVFFVGVAILLMLVVGLVATAGLWLATHFDWLEPTTVSKIRDTMPAYLGFTAGGIGLWTGAYLVTPKGSALLALSGLCVGGGFGFVLYTLGSPLWGLGMLGVGWALAVPSESLRTAAVRTLPSFILGFMTLGVEAETLLRKATLLVLGAAVGAAVVVIMATAVDPLIERRRTPA
jgi:hypothetical protein